MNKNKSFIFTILIAIIIISTFLIYGQVYYFKFIDRGWSDIGDKAVLNLNSVLGLSNDLNSNIYFFISKLLRDSNFLLQILPTYINYKDPNEVADIFTPIPNISDKNRLVLAGIIGGSVQTLVDNPIETMKIRQMTSTNNSYTIILERSWSNK